MLSRRNLTRASRRLPIYLRGIKNTIFQYVICLTLTHTCIRLPQHIDARNTSNWHIGISLCMCARVTPTIILDLLIPTQTSTTYTTPHFITIITSVLLDLHISTHSFKGTSLNWPPSRRSLLEHDCWLPGRSTSNIKYCPPSGFTSNKISIIMATRRCVST